MCYVWQRYADHPEQAAGEIKEELFYEFAEKNEKIFNYVLSGGEPFTRYEFLRNITEYLLRKKKGVWIITNGILTDRILPFAEDLCGYKENFGISVSIDGIGHVHDTVRGLPGAYEKAVETIRRLTDIKKACPWFDTSIGFTLTSNNYSQLFDVHRLSKQLNTVVNIAVALRSEQHLKNADAVLEPPSEALPCITAQIDSIIEANAADGVEKNYYFSNAITNQNLHELSAYMKRPYRRACEALGKRFLLDPYGDIYPCPFIRSKPMGNIKDNKERYFWMDKKVRKNTIRNCSCNANLFWKAYGRRFYLNALIDQCLGIARRKKKHAKFWI